MAKLSEKQTNIVYIVIGIVVVIIFAVLSYLDHGEIEELNKKYNSVQVEIAKAEQKKRALDGLKRKLYKKQKEYEYFSTYLPTERDYIKFYDTLEKFRVDNRMKAWEYFGLKKKTVEDNPNEKKKTKVAKKPVRRVRRRGAKGASGPFVAIDYEASILLTLDQLGRLLNLIETYERFYGVTSIDVSSAKGGTDGNINERAVKLGLVSFAYNGKQPLDKDIEKILSNYKVDERLREDIENDKKKKWSRKIAFTWKKPVRNPFDKFQVLINVAKDPETKDDIIIKKPIVDVDELKVTFEKIQKDRNQLHMLAVAESWTELQNSLRDRDYDKRLKRLQITSKNDPEGIFKEKLAKFKKELIEWKKAILKAKREDKARQLLIIGQKRVKEMEELYKKGKKKGSLKILEKVRAIHNEIMPQFREYSDLENDVPGLAALRKRAEEFYSRSETQIKIIQLAAKLKLKGLIYMANNPDLSVAFINEKVVHKNDILMMGFVVHEIKEDGVVLRYKEETVPIKLERVKKVANTVKRSS